MTPTRSSSTNPTSGLDPKQIHETRELVRGLAGDRTIVLSTHILPEVAATCDRVVIISRGRLRAEDTPERLAADLRRRREADEPAARIEIETAAPADAAVEKLRETAGVTLVAAGPKTPEGAVVLQIETRGSEDRRSELARTVLDSGRPLLGLRKTTASLEEVFLELTTDEPAVEPVGDEDADGAEPTEGASARSG